jgi:hypothetical protein
MYPTGAASFAPIVAEGGMRKVHPRSVERLVRGVCADGGVLTLERVLIEEMAWAFDRGPVRWPRITERSVRPVAARNAPGRTHGGR